MLAAAPLRHRSGEAGIDHHLARIFSVGAAHEPDEIVERHRTVVGIAADEIRRSAALVVRVLDRVDLVGNHAMVTRANLRLPTWITSVSPRLNCRPRSLTLSPFTRTPPCSS